MHSHELGAQWMNVYRHNLADIFPQWMLAYVRMPHHLYIDTAALESNSQTLCKRKLQWS